VVTALLKTNPPRRAEFGWPGGDRPGELIFACEIDSGLQSALLEELAVQRGEIRALVAPEGAIGRYALWADGCSWFLRVSRRHGHPLLEHAITRWLVEHGVAANHLLRAGLPFLWNGETLRLDLRPLVTGRHFDDSAEDLGRLAREIAKCHAALREFPGQAEVSNLSRDRAVAHQAIVVRLTDALRSREWRAICDDLAWAETHEEWLAELVAQYEPAFHELPGAQCLHAQIHRANVLFTDAGAPVLVDFEEAVQTFAPVSWDLAYFVQRFCLHDSPGAEVLRARLGVVRAAYGAPLAGLAEMMRQTAWFSAVILVDYHARGIRSPLAEYEKFVRLERQAVALAPLLEEFAQ
jgi:hypothetical protein